MTKLALDFEFYRNSKALCSAQKYLTATHSAEPRQLLEHRMFVSCLSNSLCLAQAPSGAFLPRRTRHIERMVAFIEKMMAFH
jgi:hypothetical protein